MIKKGTITLKKLGRIFFTIICLCLLIGCTADFFPKAKAPSSMTASESCVEFIKKVEGFSPHPYYDYSQHTIGYGTKCPTEKYFDYLANGIPESEAMALLLEAVADMSDAINQKLIEPYNLTFTQHQFDVLVSFTFNLGPAWMTYDSTLRNALLRNASDDELVYAFSLYSTAGGNYSAGLISRRLWEANLYLNGIYSQTTNGNYGYVFFDPNGGSLTYRVQGYLCDNNSSPIADAVRNGDEFLGWYTDLTGGSRVTELNSALTGKTLFARWQSSENYENQDSASTIIRVTGDVVNIRKGPGTIYGISKQVCRNDVLLLSHVTHLSNQKWGKVQDGWICLDYTNYHDVLNGSGNSDSENNSKPSEEIPIPDRQEILSGTVRVNDLLRIRSGPGTAYTTVGYLFNGNKVEILEQKAVGSMVWGRFTRGWVSMNYIVADELHTDHATEPDTDSKQETIPEEAPMIPSNPMESTAIKGKITADALRIRPAPGAVSSILGFYYQNDIVTISEKVLVDSVCWGKTDKGWISMDYVLTDSPSEDASPSPEIGQKTVVADCLRVRKAIGTDSKIAALLYYGDEVTVLETTTVDGTVWGKVSQGWICMDYVK